MKILKRITWRESINLIEIKSKIILFLVWYQHRKDFLINNETILK